MANLPVIDMVRTGQNIGRATEAGGIIGKGSAECFWFCNAAGYLQVAAGSCPSDTG